ncbi:growth arrest-specific protein 1-like [Galleria mellonella]|uniref:Growth arrest-specific protein 1-like n=1 Tax=Galleria mellonella TaxID=7137 RepID=A0A6J1X263_GALME|nr:growth arrest-specific protein 1-like [Galleria mellonella]XP_026763183.1 growth arrest-specific protein 1-like [Galleria mellonella]XP_031765672.1 growth arrest-specific protein 1-like [Galleria mellonella]
MWLIAAVLAAATVAAAIPCEDVQMQCAYRSGCGKALNNYMIFCSEVLTTGTSTCPEYCEYALIALTSTPEGKDLLNCQCKDEYCEGMKSRIEICRPQVVNGAANATASCWLSQLICLADSECAAALEYYKLLCWSMYEGRKCSRKCRNSIGILRKQKKAAALSTCQCNGDENYDCKKMQNNFARLCFHNKHGNYKDKKKKTFQPLPETPTSKKPSVVTDAASVAILSQLMVIICAYVTTMT